MEADGAVQAHKSLYYGKTMCAPMVRVSSLAFRRFCAEEGADVVFTEEMVAVKLARAVREVVEYAAVPGLRVAEFVVYEPFKSGFKRAVVFATPLADGAARFPEGAPVVAQLGAADPTVAAAAAAVVCEDVDGIDVNMGCPKKFSVDNGMGAALMRDPQRAAAILVAIDAAVNSPERVAARLSPAAAAPDATVPGRHCATGGRVPISFKTRVFDTLEESVAQLSTVFDTGVPHALSLHCRTREQRSETAPRYEFGQQLAALLRAKYPANRCPCLVLNGSVASRADGIAKCTAFGFDGALLARSAMWDPTVFARASGDPAATAAGPETPPLTAASSLEDGGARALALYRRLLAVMRDFQTPVPYVKYHLTRSFQEFPFAKIKGGVHHTLQTSRGYVQFAVALGVPAEEAERDFGDVEPLLERLSIVAAAPTAAVSMGDADEQELKRRRTEPAEPAPASGVEAANAGQGA